MMKTSNSIFYFLLNEHEAFQIITSAFRCCKKNMEILFLLYFCRSICSWNEFNQFSASGSFISQHWYCFSDSFVIFNCFTNIELIKFEEPPFYVILWDLIWNSVGIFPSFVWVVVTELDFLRLCFRKCHKYLLISADLWCIL